jgi:hypothetical protein
VSLFPSLCSATRGLWKLYRPVAAGRRERERHEHPCGVSVVESARPWGTIAMNEVCARDAHPGWWSALLALLAVAGIAGAAEHRPPAKRTLDADLRVHVSLVLIPVHVTN